MAILLSINSRIETSFIDSVVVLVVAVVSGQLNTNTSCLSLRAVVSLWPFFLIFLSTESSSVSSGSVMKKVEGKPGGSREVKKTTLPSTKPTPQRRPPIEKKKSTADDGSLATVNLKVSGCLSACH